MRNSQRWILIMHGDRTKRVCYSWGLLLSSPFLNILYNNIKYIFRGILILVFIPILFLSCIILFIFTIIFLTLPGPVEEEVLRIQSPNGKFDAIVYEINTWAADPFYCDVYVLKTRSKPRLFDRPIANVYAPSKGRCAASLKIRWEGDQRLQVNHSTARSEALMKPHIEIGKAHVEVIWSEMQDK